MRSRGEEQSLKMKKEGEGLMVKVVNGGIPGLDKIVAILTIKFIGMFFDFKGFPNETG
jgi:hypothetical protein